MKKQIETELDIEIDKLTNSIENTITNEVFDTEITQLYRQDRKQIKMVEWVFEWHKEFENTENQIFKLTTINNPKIIHGLICFSDKHDHILIRNYGKL